MQYMGSKNRIAKYIIPIIQSYIDNMEDCKGYLEPFVGGANVIDKIKCDNKIGCDIHEYLIALLNHCKETVDDLPNVITEEEYYKVKTNKDDYEKWYVGLVGFCGSFGAKWFGGYARANKYDNTGCRSTTAINTIKKQSINFKNCNFICGDYYEKFKPDNIKGYVIYCDIPYKNSTSYETNKFDYDKFYEWAKTMSKDNIVLVSEYSMPEDFTCIWEKEIVCKLKADDNKSKRTEKLFIYKQ